MTLENELKIIDDHFKSIQKEALKTSKDNWKFLEKLIKEGNRNNDRQVLHAAECIVNENAEFIAEKRKYHLIRNALIKGHNLHLNATIDPSLAGKIN